MSRNLSIISELATELPFFSESRAWILSRSLSASYRLWFYLSSPIVFNKLFLSPIILCLSFSATVYSFVCASNLTASEIKCLLWS